MDRIIELAGSLINSLLWSSPSGVLKALGGSIKRPTAGEKANLPIVRKSIVAARPINAGEIFTEDNITVKRPGTGISPMQWDC